MIPSLIPTKADTEIKECIGENRSFSVISGAGSGKTKTLLQKLIYLIIVEETAITVIKNGSFTGPTNRSAPAV